VGGSTVEDVVDVRVKEVQVSEIPLRHGVLACAKCGKSKRMTPEVRAQYVRRMGRDVCERDVARMRCVDCGDRTVFWSRA
jgi:hypothetical protein